MEENKNVEEEKEEGKDEGLRFAPWIGAGFGLIAAGYLARYFLGLFSSMKGSIPPSIGNILIDIGIIVTIVSLAAEIFTALKEK